MSDDDPPGLNAPRQKARFRSQYDNSVYRRAPLPKREPAEVSASPSSGQEPPPESGTEGEPSGPVALVGDETSRETTAEDHPAAAEVEAEQSDLLPNFRLNKVYEARPPERNPLTDWRWWLVSAGVLALGLGGGYFWGLANAPAQAMNRAATKLSEKTVLKPVSPEVQARLDAAFDATKKGRYKEAAELFSALHQDHPEWWSMSIESARASLYEHEAQDAQRALKEVTVDQGLPDADFIMGLLHLTNREFDLSETSFAAAVARDPARPDFYYFWGECLRRDGKPREAVDKFRAALLRNQYENFEGLYQIKLWLSQIQADQENSSGANQEIDAVLATSHPTYEALFAAAARELKAKRYQGAVGYIAKAQAVTEPAVFRVIMQDPAYLEEATAHAELAPFYQ